MKLKIGNKEYKIKYAYLPTLKSNVLKKLGDITNIMQGNEVDLSTVEKLLIFLPELLLAGLQANHKEFRYDYNSQEEKEKKIEKVSELIEEYLEEDKNGDPNTLFTLLQNSLFEDSFLKNLFKNEIKKE